MWYGMPLLLLLFFFLPQGRGDVNMECYSFVKHDILFTGRVVRVAALVEPRLV